MHHKFISAFKECSLRIHTCWMYPLSVELKVYTSTCAHTIMFLFPSKMCTDWFRWMQLYFENENRILIITGSDCLLLPFVFPKLDWGLTDSEVCGIHLFHIHSICSWCGMSCLFFPFVLSQGFRGAHSNRLADIYLHTVVLGICVNEPQVWSYYWNRCNHGIHQKSDAKDWLRWCNLKLEYEDLQQMARSQNK
jgi:hypothetical protein